MPPRILLPLIVACALFMENLDSTILSTALPAIALDFNDSPIRLKLALTSYLLSLAVFIPASGWLADRFSARDVFRLAIITFMAGSICCALSQSIGQLVAARVIQGLGGAMMVPVGRLLILRNVEKSVLVSSMAWLTVPALIGPIAGPPLGGFITTYFDWRYVFWINIPIGCLGVILASIHIPDTRSETVRPFDGLGFVLAGGGLALFVTSSTSLGLHVLSMPVLAVLFATGSAMLLAYYWHYRRTTDPILDLSLFAIPTFAITVLGGSMFRLGVGAAPFLLPLMFQLAFGMSPFQSGSITFVSAIGAIAMKFAVAPLLRRFGFRNLLIFNALPAALFIAAPAFFSPAVPIALILGVLLFGGFIRSLQFTLINSVAYADISQERLSRATGMVSVIQQLALSLGISVGAIALQISSAGSTTFTAATFTPAFVIIGALSSLSWLIFRLLPSDAGEEMSGRIRPDTVTAMRERG